MPSVDGYVQIGLSNDAGRLPAEPLRLKHKAVRHPCLLLLQASVRAQSDFSGQYRDYCQELLEFVKQKHYVYEDEHV